MKTVFLIVISLLIWSISFAQFNDYEQIELITFESESSYFQQATPTSDIWQIGKPSKTNFFEAYSVPNAIVTDTLNPYPTNTKSWFDLILPMNDFLWYYESVNISFNHKLHTPTHFDGGYITVSYDMGNTWQNIINDTVHWFGDTPNSNWNSGGNLYTSNDTLFNGEYGFSGDISDWQNVMFEWVSIRVKKSGSLYEDTMMVRFNFISDTINTNSDGWMIDDLRLISVDWGGAIHELPFMSNLEFYPNPCVDNTIIQSKDKQGIRIIQVYNLNGQLLKEDENRDAEYLFFKDELPTGTYFLKCTFDDKTTESIKILIQ